MTFRDNLNFGTLVTGAFFVRNALYASSHDDAVILTYRCESRRMGFSEKTTLPPFLFA